MAKRRPETQQELMERWAKEIAMIPVLEQRLAARYSLPVEKIREIVFGPNPYAISLWEWYYRLAFTERNGLGHRYLPKSDKE